MPSDKLVFTTGTLATPTYPRHEKERLRKEAARARPSTPSNFDTPGYAGGDYYGRAETPIVGKAGSPLFEPLACDHERSPEEVRLRDPLYVHTH